MSHPRARHRAPTATGTVVARTTALGLLAAAPLGVAVAPASAAERTAPMPAATGPLVVVPAVAPVVRAVPGLAAAAKAAAAAAPARPNWGPIIACESSGNPRADNPDPNSTASGLYQFLDSTWRELGGRKYAPRAMHATVAQQTEIANKQYAISGYKAWNASRFCWRNKIDAPSSPRVTEPAPRVSTPQRATPQRATPRATPQRSAPHVSTPSRQHVGHGKAITVRSGDTLGKIAARNGTTWRHLYDANRGVVRNPNVIFPGQRLAA